MMRRLMYGVLASVLLIALTLHNLPYLIRDQVVLWLYHQQVDVAELKSIEVEWLQGRVGLKELRVEKEGFEPLKLTELQFDLSLSALVDHRVLIESLTVNGLFGAISQQEDALRVGPLLIPMGTSTADTGNQDSAPWLVGIERISISNLEWSAQYQGLKTELQIEQLALKDLYQWSPDQMSEFSAAGQINRAPFTLSSQAFPLKPSPQASVSLKLDNFFLAPVMEAVALPLAGEVSVDLKLDLNLADMNVVSSGLVQIDQLSYQAADITAELQQLRWQGDHLWQGTPEVKAISQLKGVLSAKAINAGFGDQQLKLASMHWSGEKQLQLVKDQLEVNSTASLLLKGVDYAQPQLHALVNGFNTDGNVNAKLSDSMPLTLNMQQSWSSEGLKLIKDQIQMNASGSESVVGLELKGEALVLDIPKFIATQIKTDIDGHQLVAMDSLNLQTLQTDTKQAALGGLKIVGLAVAQVEQQHLSQLGELAVHNLSWHPQKLKIDEVALSGGETLIRLNEQGELTDIQLWKQHLKALSGTDQSEGAETAETLKPEHDSAPMQIKVERVLIKQPHQINFQDRSVEPFFNLQADLNQFQVGPYNTESAVLTSLQLSAQLGSFGELVAEGALDLAQAMENGHWSAEVKGLELPSASPYALKHTGYYIQSGQLGLTSSGTLKAGVLEGKNDLGLFNFDVEPRAQEQVDEFSKKLSMPLETAVMVLEDDNENINLELPVTGSLQDPSFGLQSVVGMLAGKGLKTAAFSYLTKALQPYATLISLATSVVEANQKGSFINLSPVVFEAGSADINTETQGYLAKLVEMMSDRPAMRLKLCGQAVAADHQVLRTALQAENKKRKKPLKADQLEAKLAERLQTLAQQRGEQVKASLIDQVAAERLFLCYPQVNLEGEKGALSPRVDLGL